MSNKLNHNEEKKILDFINFLKSCSRNHYKITEIFHFAEKHGFHFTPTHFYSPIPTVYELDDKLFDAKENIHFDWNEKFAVLIANPFLGYNHHEKLLEFQKSLSKKIFFPQGVHIIEASVFGIQVNLIHII